MDNIDSKFGGEVVPLNLELPQVKVVQPQNRGKKLPKVSAKVGSDFTVQGIDLNYVGVI